MLSSLRLKLLKLFPTLLRIAPAAMLPVLLAVVLRVVRFYEDLIGVTIEICVPSDADVGL